MESEKVELFERGYESSNGSCDMKTLLDEVAESLSQGIPDAVKEKALHICAAFLGGAWEQLTLENMMISCVKGGTSNLLFLCRLPSEISRCGDEPREVLFRINCNRESSQKLLIESTIFLMLSERNLGPKLYGIFRGGRLEEYLPSRALTNLEMQQPVISESIAKKLAHIHQLRVPIIKSPTYITESLLRWMRLLKKNAKQFPSFSLDIGSKTIDVNEQRLSSEFHFVRQYLEHVYSPVVFCHNDLQQGNILLSERHLSDSNEVILIDFEYSSYNYRGFDIADHFNEWMYDYAIQSAPGFNVHHGRFPTSRQQNVFYGAYLRELQQPVNEEALDALGQEVMNFVPVSNFFWAVWSLVQCEVSPIDFGYMKYAEVRFALYFKARQAMSKIMEDSRGHGSFVNHPLLCSD